MKKKLGYFVNKTFLILIIFLSFIVVETYVQAQDDLIKLPAKLTPEIEAVKPQKNPVGEAFTVFVTVNIDKETIKEFRKYLEVNHADLKVNNNDDALRELISCNTFREAITADSAEYSDGRGYLTFLNIRDDRLLCRFSGNYNKFIKKRITDIQFADTTAIMNRIYDAFRSNDKVKFSAEAKNFRSHLDNLKLRAKVKDQYDLLEQISNQVAGFWKKNTISKKKEDDKFEKDLVKLFNTANNRINDEEGEGVLKVVLDKDKLIQQAKTITKKIQDAIVEGDDAKVTEEKKEFKSYIETLKSIADKNQDIDLEDIIVQTEKIITIEAGKLKAMDVNTLGQGLHDLFNQLHIRLVDKDGDGILKIILDKDKLLQQAKAITKKIQDAIVEGDDAKLNEETKEYEEYISSLKLIAEKEQDLELDEISYQVVEVIPQNIDKLWEMAHMDSIQEMANILDSVYDQIYLIVTNIKSEEIDKILKEVQANILAEAIKFNVTGFRPILVNVDIMGEQEVADLFGKQTAKEFITVKVKFNNNLKGEDVVGKAILAYRSSVEVAIEFEKMYDKKSKSGEIISFNPIYNPNSNAEIERYKYAIYMKKKPKNKVFDNSIIYREDPLKKSQYNSSRLNTPHVIKKLRDYPAYSRWIPLNKFEDLTLINKSAHENKLNRTFEIDDKKHLFRYRPYKMQLMVDTVDNRDGRTIRSRLFKLLKLSRFIASWIIAFDEPSDGSDFPQALEQFGNMVAPGMEEIFPNLNAEHKSNILTHAMNELEKIPYGTPIEKIVFIPKKPARGILRGHVVRISEVHTSYFKVEVGILEKEKTSSENVAITN